MQNQKNQKAKDLLADVWEQLGYQSEGAGLRNIYLTGAKELRDGIVPVKAVKTGSPDFIRGTSTEMFLKYLGIQMDSRQAEGKQFKINLITPDNGEKFVLELSNATLTTAVGYQAKDADLSITINRTDLEVVMIGQKKLMQLVAEGKAKLEGNKAVLQELTALLVKFDPWFEILPGTKKKASERKYKQEAFENDSLVSHASVSGD